MSMLVNMDSKKFYRRSMLLGCAVAFVIMLLYFGRKSPRDINGFMLESVDREIKISWENPQTIFIDHIELSIYDRNEDNLSSIYLPASCHEFSFHNGIHGELYIFSLKAKFKDGTYGQEFLGERLYLEFEQLPDLPIISINTVGGTAPTHDIAIKEDELWLGESIVNNEFVAGSMYFLQNGQNDISSKLKIRVRGNTSAVFTEKKSYKIVLDDPLDLLGWGSEFADREWILLNTGADLKTYIGGYLANLCGMEWTPRMRFVNVMLNNDWKGIYLLIESVKRGNARCNISQTGYLFESDAYWWNSEGIYFQTQYTPAAQPVGFTFKYPKVKSSEDQEVIRLKKYMEEFENYLYAGDEQFWEYIDIDSFVSWILVRDIMGDIDGAGSNIYYNIYALNTSNPTASKLKMGPLWDFDASFIAEPEAFSKQHRTASVGGLYFAELFKYELFNEAYCLKWNEVKNGLVPGLENMLAVLYDEQGDALEESRILDGSRYIRRNQTAESEILDRIQWICDKEDWMNGVLNGAGG